jgi:class 3 adenylate cyclase
MVGSTALAEAFDVEDVATAVGTVVGTAVLTIERYGGTVADVAGDGVVGVFGAGAAAVADAIRAGLQITEAVSREPVALTSRSAGTQATAVTLRLRAGVEVTTDGRTRSEGIAEARRFETAATPGSVLVGSRARRLVDHWFEWDLAPAGRPGAATVRSALAASGRSARTRAHRVRRSAPNAMVAYREERKTVVVLFAGFDAGADVDPVGLTRRARAVVERYGGWSAETAGRVLGLFGAPVVHEDDAERAVLAGVEIVRVASVARSSGRIGIASGPVVLGPYGAGEHIEYTALGDAVNTACRLHEAATAGAVVVPRDLYDGLRSRFETAGEPVLTLKGKSSPVHAVLVSGSRPAATRPRPRSAALVGREQERASVARAVERFVGGDGAFVLIEGDPGIGKSLLAADACALAEARLPNLDVSVLQASSYASTVPFWPMRPAIDRWVDGANVRLQRADVDVLRLVGGASPLPPGNAGEQIRTDALHSRVTTLMVEGLAKQHDVRPTALVFEDVHWADVHTIGLIERLVDETRLLVVATCRRDGGELVGRLKTVLPGLCLDLGPLPDGTAAAFLDAMVGQAVLPWTVERRILALAEGNPFFLEQLVRGLISDGRLRRCEGGWRYVGAPNAALPDTVERVVLARIECLASPARAVLDVAAVLGSSVDIEVLEAVTEYGAEVEGSVAALVKAALLAESLDEPARYVFAHAILHETAYGNLLRRHRIALHARCAAALVRLRRGDQRVWEDIARHAWEGGNAELALEWAEQAAGDALARLSFHQAARCYELASRAAGRLGRDGREGVRIGLALGDARRGAGLLHEAMDSFERAAVGAAEIGDYAMQAHAALGFEDACYASRQPRVGESDPSTVLLEGALGAVPSAETGLVTRLSASLAVAVSFAGDLDRGLQLSDDALRVARAEGDPTVIARALQAWRLVRRAPSFLQARYRCARAMVTAAREAGDRELTFEAARLRLIDELELGWMRRADRTVVEIGTLVHDLRQPLYLWYPPMWRAMRLLHRGNLHAADEAIDAFRTSGRRHGYQDVDLVHGLLVFLLRREQGRAAELEDLCRRLAEQTRRWRPVLAALAVELGDPDGAGAILDDYCAGRFREVPRDQAIGAPIAMLADAAVATSHAGAAEALKELALPFQHQHLVVGSGAVCLGATSQILGFLAAASGRTSEAGGWFLRAMRQHRAADSPLLAAHSACEAAVAFGPLADDELRAAVARADRVARRTGSVRLARRVEEALRRGRSPRARSR